MTAANQLVDGGILRAEILAGNLNWRTSDPGTGVLPTNRILTWGEYTGYVSTFGTTEFINTFCPDFGTMTTYRIIVPPPTMTLVQDQSFCDAGTPSFAVYQIYLEWTNAGAYSTRVYFDESFTGTTVSSGVTSALVSTFDGFHSVTVRHYDGTYESVDSNALTLTVGTLSC